MPCLIKLAPFFILKATAVIVLVNKFEIKIRITSFQRGKINNRDQRAAHVDLLFRENGVAMSEKWGGGAKFIQVLSNNNG